MIFRGNDMRRSFLLLSAVLLVLAAAISTVCAANSVSAVRVADKRVELSASNGFEQMRYFTLDSPKRLVVDLYGVQPDEQSNSYNLSDGFKSLRVGPYEDKTRFVFDVSGQSFPTFKVKNEKDRVVVTWEDTADIASQAASEAPSVGRAQVTAIDFTSEAGQSKFLISVNGTAEATQPTQTGTKVQFALKNATLPRALRRIFDTFAFPSAIQSVTPYLVNVAGQPQVRFSVVLKGSVPYQLQKTANGFVLNVNDGKFAKTYPPVAGMLPVPVKGAEIEAGASAEAAPSVPAPAPVPGSMTTPVIDQVEVDSKKFTGEKISLVFSDIDIKDVMRIIADVSNLNIIVPDDVKGNVTLRLIDVPWDQALDLILKSKGLDMLREGNVVQVLPVEKIRSMKEAELTATHSQEKLEPLKTEVVTVSYADLGKVAGPVKETLSERGSITEDSRNKLLIINDIPARIEKAKQLISILDTPERQVMIEARIVQVNSNYSRDLGINWFLQGQNSPNRNVQGIAGAGGGFLVDVTDETVGSLIATPGLATQLQFGRTLVDDIVLNLQLSAMESDGKGKIISSPRVTTMNGEKATISQGTSIPYQTSGADGPKTEFVNAELKLEVTPVINPDNSIILKILATNDSPSLTAGATAPSIDTKKAETKVLIKDGETTVIGGIYVENNQDSQDGVPGLMNIPLLGNLFKSSKKQTTKDELLVFITPRIVHAD